jgi:inner membrane protein
MIARIVGELGPWNWVAIGLVLLALEIAIPGVFLLWFGIAGIIIGTLTLMFNDASFWPWEVQVLGFLILSIVLAYKGKQLMDRGDVTDQPLLNQRAAQLVGRTVVLIEPISEGVGRISLDDTQWRVVGPDLPGGTRVKVLSILKGGELAIEAA